MKLELFFVRNFISSRKKRNFISFISYIAIMGVMLGSATLIIALSILDGFEKTINEKVIGFAAHIRVQGFLSSPIENYREDMEKMIKGVPEIKRISPFTGKEAMIKSRSDIDGIYVNGIDEKTDFSSTRSQIIRGEYNIGQDPGTSLDNVIIGNKLAKKFKLDIGSKVVILGITGLPTPMNMPKITQFRVSGIYESGMSEYDDVNIYISLKASQTLFKLGDAVSGYSIEINDPKLSQDVCSRIMVLMGYPYYARSIYTIYQNLFSWVNLQKEIIPLVLVLIIAVAAFNIIGMLLMLVMEKTSEIGILKSMGASSFSIMKIFVLQGFFISVIGTILGNILGFVLCWVQLRYKIFSIPSSIYYMDSVPVLLNVSNFIIVSLLSLILCFFATLIPAYIASKLNPINSIRFS
jgi:lipoprotein-releasing system permease protein